jgi:hypothetical protein
MRQLILILAAGAIAFAADAPLPLSIEDQETLSRAMLVAQAAQIDLLHAQAAADKATSAYLTALAAAQKKAGAPGNCEITIEKQWQCSTPSPAPATTP